MNTALGERLNDLAVEATAGLEVRNPAYRSAPTNTARIDVRPFGLIAPDTAPVTFPGVHVVNRDDLVILIGLDDSGSIRTHS